MITKKGAGEAVSALIMFIAIVGITTGLVITFKNYISDTQSSLDYQNQETSNKLRTSIAITNIYYNATGNYVYVYVKNTGETKLDANVFDVYVDDEYVRDYGVYEAGNLSSSLRILQPQETIALRYNTTLGSGTHEFRVVTEYGVGTEETENI